MPPAIVQSNGGTRSGSGASYSRAFVSSVTAGNTLVALAAAWSATLGTGAVTDSQGNTWTRQVAALNNDGVTIVAAIYTATAGSTGACTVTVTPNAGTWMALSIAECSGINAIGNSGIYEGSATGFAAASSAVSTAHDAVLFGVLRYAVGATMTEGAGWSVISEDETFANVPNAEISRTEAASGTFTASWSLTGGAVSWAAIACLALEGTGGTGGAVRLVGPMRIRTRLVGGVLA